MAISQTMTPTAYYKSTSATGAKLTILEPSGADAIIVDGVIDEVYWSSDAGGVQRITNIEYGMSCFLIVKTTDIENAVSLLLESNELTSDDMENGVIGEGVVVPLLVDPATGKGFGFYPVGTWDEDEMSFRNSKWQDVTADRILGSMYVNDTGMTICVNVTLTLSNIDATHLRGVISVDGVPVVTHTDGNQSSNASNSILVRGPITISTIVPPNSTYSVTAENATAVWNELRKVVV